MSKILIDEATVKLALEALRSMANTLAEHQEPTTFYEDEAMRALKALAEQPAQQEPGLLGGDQCDRLFTLVMSKLASKHNPSMLPEDLNPNIVTHHALRHSIIQAAFTAGVVSAAPQAQPAPAAPVQQEPVAWIVTTEMQDGDRGTFAMMGRLKDVIDCCDFGTPVPLYATPQPAPVQQEIEEYDAGLLSAGGGGDVEWWWDYIRAELGRAYDHYQSQMTAPQAQPAPEIAIADAYRAGVDSGIAAEREACAKVCDEVDKESQSQWPKRLSTMIRARGNT